MNHSTRPSATAHYSPRAFRAALGYLLRLRQIGKPVEDSVPIGQKTRVHTPLQKLRDAFLALRAGARGLVEVEKRLRNAPVLQHAFGRNACAEQSSLQETLDACKGANGVQMQQAFVPIYQKPSPGFGQDYQTQWQLLEADRTGRVWGPKAEFATNGSLAQKPHRRARPLARCIATPSHESVAAYLYDGKPQLPTALLPLLEQAGQVGD